MNVEYIISYHRISLVVDLKSIYSNGFSATMIYNFHHDDLYLKSFT